MHDKQKLAAARSTARPVDCALLQHTCNMFGDVMEENVVCRPSICANVSGH